MRNVEGRTPGEKAIELTLSSGADETSTSFMGFIFAWAFPNTAVVPNVEPDVAQPPPPPNIDMLKQNRFNISIQQTTNQFELLIICKTTDTANQ